MNAPGPVESVGGRGPVDAVGTPSELEARDVAWFERTGHCGGCGQPGAYCHCTPRRPCGCRHLHAMGAGIVDGALDQFAIDGPAPVGDDQGELFS